MAIAKLRAVREGQGVTLTELAARAGMTRSQRRPPRIAKNATLRTLDRYARALGCKLEIDVVAVNLTK